VVQWDPKITTLPGLYLLSVGVLMPLSAVLRIDLCGTYALRMTNVFACFANFYIIHNIQKRLHPERKVSVVYMQQIHFISLCP
jgi:alpha-1,2-glucosyltransferase